MKYAFVIFLVICIILAGCQNNNVEVPQTATTESQCTVNSDCRSGEECTGNKCQTSIEKITGGTVIETKTSVTTPLPTAKIAFSPADVELNGIKIKKISFQINNEADIVLRAKVDASWYDSSDKAVMEDKVCGYQSILVPPEVAVSGSITEFIRTYPNPENSEETIVLRLYDFNTNKTIDTATVKINI